MPPRKPATGPADKPTPKNILLWFRQWLEIKTQTDTLVKRQKDLRDRLGAAIEEKGYTDDKGSLYLDLPEEVEGFAGLKYECRVSQSLSEERAMALIKSKGLENRCIVMVPEIDQEEIYKAHYEGLVSQEELDGIFDTSTNFAFKQIKA